LIDHTIDLEANASNAMCGGCHNQLSKSVIQIALVQESSEAQVL
jgi:hypothetical protein